MMKRHENNIRGSRIRTIITYTGDNWGTLGPRFAVQAQDSSMEEMAQDQLAEFLNEATGRNGSERKISEKLEKDIVSDFSSVLKEEKERYIYTGRKSVEIIPRQYNFDIRRLQQLNPMEGISTIQLALIQLALKTMREKEYESAPKKITRVNNTQVVDESGKAWSIGITPVRISLNAKKLDVAQTVGINTSSKKENEMGSSHLSAHSALLIIVLYAYGLSYKQSLEQNNLNQAVCAAAREFTLLPHIKYRDSIYGKDNIYGTMPTAFFENIEKFSFQSRKGVKPSDAIKSIFNKEQKSLILDCSTGVQIIHYKALLDFLGEEKFNEVFPIGIRIEQYISEKNPTVRVRDQLSSDWYTILKSPENMLGKITPGDLVYIANIKPYAKRHPSGESPGFNVIYLGKNEIGKHEFGSLFREKKVHTYDEIIDLMIRNYNEMPYDMKDKVVQANSNRVDGIQPTTTFEGTLVKELQQLSLN